MHRLSRLLFIIVVLLTVACSGSSKKAVIKPVVVAPTMVAPVLSPEHTAQYNAALQSMKKTDYPAAASVFKQLLTHYPRLAGAYVNLALIAEAQSKTEEALDLYEKALAINPNNVDALIQRAHFNQEKGLFEAAAQDLMLAEAVDSRNPLIQFNLGIIYELYLQDYDEAIQHYEKYIKHSSSDDVEMVKRWIKMLERK